MIIYKVINKINNKIYIGQTIQTLEKRWHKHGRESRNDHFSNAIKKYGKENFTIEQIDTANTIEELNEKEVYWISFYNSTDREIGYNLKEGGNNCPCPEETKKKIGNSNTGRKPSDLAIQKSREKRLGQKLSDETKQKMSESKRGHIVSEQTKEKLREKRKSYIVSSETKKKQSAAKLGKKQTPEQIEKRRLGMIGKKRSKEFCENLRNKIRPKEVGEKISASKKVSGYKHSEETKAKQRANFKGRTGQKNNPESLKKMVLTKARKKLLRTLNNILDKSQEIC